MEPRRGYNPKRRVAAAGTLPTEERARLAQAARYAGNPEHKRLSGDFDLTPPTNPRPGKTLCDEAGVVAKASAWALLRSGMEKGMISLQRRNGWPRNVWSVAEGTVFEAQLENEVQGSYHGYPLPLDDDFRATILREWKER